MCVHIIYHESDIIIVDIAHIRQQLQEWPCNAKGVFTTPIIQDADRNGEWVGALLCPLCTSRVFRIQTYALIYEQPNYSSDMGSVYHCLRLSRCKNDTNAKTVQFEGCLTRI